MAPSTARVKRKLASGVKAPPSPILPREAVFQAAERTRENSDLTYDSRHGRVLLTTTPEGRQALTAFDSDGRVIEVLPGGLLPVSFTYDIFGRTETMTHGSGLDARVWTYTYYPHGSPSAGFLNTVTDPLERTVSFEYDEVGRVVLQTMPDGRQIGFNYDPNGNVTVITPPGRPDHTFDYTPVDLEGQYDPPDVGVVPDDTQYFYNSDRQLTQVLRPDGQTIDFAYNATTGRLETVTAPHGVTTPSYDPVTGNVTSVTGPGGEILGYVYDGSLLTDVTWSGIISGTVSRGFDNNFRTISRTVNGADTVLFDYDNDGLLTQAGDLLIVRDPVIGFVDTTTLGVVTTDRVYTDFGELESEIAQVSGADSLSRVYGRDDLGRITSITETIGGVTTFGEYQYDLRGRLWQVYEDGGLVREYEYDDNGNRLSVSDAVSVLVTATYDDQDRLLEHGNNTYEYTPAGELLTRTVGGVDTTYYTYDVYGNLVTVELPDGTVIDYVIDASNRRIGRVVNGFLEQGFLYRDGLNPVAELDGTGVVVSRFVYGTRGNLPEYMVRGGNTYRIVADHLGSVRMVVDVSTGVVAQEMEYDEWGNVVVDTNPGFTPFGFAGGIYDSDTGLVRFGARDYDPEVGRWTTRDPIGFGGGFGNHYAYVGNNPVNRTDPTGLQALMSEDPTGRTLIMSFRFHSSASSEYELEFLINAFVNAIQSYYNAQLLEHDIALYLEWDPVGGTPVEFYPFVPGSHPGHAGVCGGPIGISVPFIPYTVAHEVAHHLCIVHGEPGIIVPIGPDNPDPQLTADDVERILERVAQAPYCGSPIESVPFWSE